MHPSTYFTQVHDNHKLNDNDPIYEDNLVHINVELKQHQKTTLHKMITKETFLKSRTSSLPEYFNKYNHQFPNEFININSNIGFLANTVGSGKTLIILSLISHSKNVEIENKNLQYNNDLLYYNSDLPRDICSVISYYHNDNSINLNYYKNNIGIDLININDFINIINTNLIVVPHSLINQWKNEIKSLTTFNVLTINNIRDIRTLLAVDNIYDFLNEFDIILCNANKYNDLMNIQNEFNIKWQRVFFDEADTIKIPNQKICATNFLWLLTATYERFCERNNIGFLNNIIQVFKDFFSLKQVEILTNVFIPTFSDRNYSSRFILDSLTIKCDDDFIKQNLIVQIPNINNIIIENTPDIIKFIISLKYLSKTIKQKFLNNHSKFYSIIKDVINDNQRYMIGLEFPVENLFDIRKLLSNNYYSCRIQDNNKNYRLKFLYNLNNIFSFMDFTTLYKNICKIEHNQLLKYLITYYTSQILRIYIRIFHLFFTIEENKFNKNKRVSNNIDTLLKYLSELDEIIQYINRNKICIICEKNIDQNDMYYTNDKYCNFHYHFHCHVQDSELVHDYINIIGQNKNQFIYRKYGYNYLEQSYFTNTEYIGNSYKLHPFIINFSKIMSYIYSFNNNIYNKTIHRVFLHTRLANFISIKQETNHHSVFLHKKLTEFIKEDINIETNNYNFLLKNSFHNQLSENIVNINEINTYSFIESKIDFVKQRYINSYNKKILFFSDSELIFNKIKKFLNNNDVKWGTISGNNKTIAKRLRDYTTGNLNVLLLNNNFFASGINLQNTTDIIILNYIDEYTMTQIIGRAQRIGRDINNKLNVNYILFESENYQ